MALDDERGRMFLRVLLQLAMTNHPPLVSKAIKLLMRHFSQRKEVVAGFKQVSVFVCYLLVLLTPLLLCALGAVTGVHR